MKIFSTFTGIGGFELGISRAAIPRQLNGLELVGYSEIDKYAVSVFERHYKGTKNYGDITKIDAQTLPEFDCIVGGFPCQAFSIAGRRAGFNDTRGTLFFELARILKAKQPRLFVFENVKGLLNHDHGRTFRTIIATIDELGYDCQWQVLNSKDFGVPQNRERVIIVGHLRGTPRPKVFPITGSSSAPNAASEHERKGTEKFIRARHLSQNGTLISDTAALLASEPLHILVPEATKKGYAIARPGQAVNLSHPNSKTRRGRVADISPTLETSTQIHTVTDDMAIRRLTPIECERLQAFPDDWTKYDFAGNVISDAQRYKMCGNAVTTNVIQAVFKGIFA